eukprot:GDKI01043881.1.p1 GENE.GDKI01043881.1~~GDKI01043881.1.p1  ORF type:complete len:552 (-),score=218.43 GDKI01043881.1:242-1840(-)
MGDLKDDILLYLDKNESIKDSTVLALEKNWDHNKMVGAIKSLGNLLYVTSTTFEKKSWVLTDEGKLYVTKGAPEAQVFDAVKAAGPSGIPQAQLNEQLGEVAKIGFAKAMQNKWVVMNKETKSIVATADSIVDDVRQVLQGCVDLGESDVAKFEATFDKKKLEDLKKRKMLTQQTLTAFTVHKGENFSTEVKKPEADITHDMITKKTWASTTFKEYNFVACGRIPPGGHLHPLLKVRTEFRKILLNMGFEEMPTNQWVESSFWNFDTLFQPQQHPARDAHDTFFLKEPMNADRQKIPSDYLERVRTIHEKGGEGSVGYRYEWSEDEAMKNILRTHTTAVSSRMLYRLAQEHKKTGVWTPKRYFSIDRVFRNETLDATHLAEFHQVEGLVADKNLSLGHLIGTIREFFSRIGITNLRFKPAYNPYTEPSMEIFGYHPLLKRWVEIGNSGIFRPEMLRPMGLPADVTVVAWGLSLERPTMIQYGVANIRDLFGHRVDLNGLKTNPLCWLGNSRHTHLNRPFADDHHEEYVPKVH